MKKFNELTETGKKRRLNNYAKELAEKGLTEELFSVVSFKRFKPIKKKGFENSRQAVISLVKRVNGKREFYTALAYVGEGRDALAAYYENLKPGQLVSVTYRELKTESEKSNLISVWEIHSRDRVKNTAATVTAK